MVIPSVYRYTRTQPQSAPPRVREVLGSIPVEHSEFSIVPRSCHVDQLTFQAFLLAMYLSTVLYFVNKHVTDLRTLPPLSLYNRAPFSLDFLPEKSCFLLGCVGTLGVDDWLFLVVLRDRRIPLFFLTGRSSVRGRVASSPVP